MGSYHTLIHSVWATPDLVPAFLQLSTLLVHILAVVWPCSLSKQHTCLCDMKIKTSCTNTRCLYTLELSWGTFEGTRGNLTMGTTVFSTPLPMSRGVVLSIEVGELRAGAWGTDLNSLFGHALAIHRTASTAIWKKACIWLLTDTAVNHLRVWARLKKINMSFCFFKVSTCFHAMMLLRTLTTIGKG